MNKISAKAEMHSKQEWTNIKPYQDRIDSDNEMNSEIQQEGRQAKINIGKRINTKMEEVGQENNNPNHRNGGIQKTAIIQTNINNQIPIYGSREGQLNSFEITMKQKDNFSAVDLKTTQKAKDQAFKSFQHNKKTTIQNQSFNTTKGGQFIKQTYSGDTSQTEGTLLSHASINKLLESTTELQDFIGANKLNEMQESLNMKRVQVHLNPNLDGLLHQEKEVKKCCFDYEKKITKIEQQIQEKGQVLKKHFENKQSYKNILDSQLLQNKSKLDNLENDFQTTMEQMEAQRDISKQALIVKNRQFQTQEYQNLELSNEISYLKGEISKEQKILGKQKLMEKLPLEQELDRMEQMKIKFISDIKIIQEKKKRNFDQICMLKEDDTQSNSIKENLAYQIEEYQHHQQDHLNNIDFYHINKLVKNEKQLNIESMKHGIYEQLVQMKQRNILHVLIRELQQYIMSMFSGKTDCSMINSENLDKLSQMLDSSQISLEHAVKMLCECAKTKVDCNLDQNQILAKLQLEYQNFDAYIVDQMIEKAIQIENKIRSLSSKIKQITKRINVELKPQIYALEETNVQLLEQNHSRLQGQILQMDEQLKKKKLEIKLLSSVQTQRRNDFGSQIEFTERMNQISQYENEIVERNDSLIQTKREIQAHQKNIKNTTEQIRVLQGNLEFQKQGLVTQINEIESQKPKISNSIIDDEISQKLLIAIQQLQLEKDQAINIQKYAIKKYEGILENIQNVNNNEKMGQSKCHYGSTQSSRMNNIQTQSQNLMQGKILSPSDGAQSGESIKQNISIEDQSDTHFSEQYTDIGENTNKFNDMRNVRQINVEQMQSEKIEYSSEKNPVVNGELNQDIKLVENEKYSQLHQKQIEIALNESIQPQMTVPQSVASKFGKSQLDQNDSQEVLHNTNEPSFIINQKIQRGNKENQHQVQMDVLGAQSLNNYNSNYNSGVQTQSMSMREIPIVNKETTIGLDDELHLSMLNVDISDPSFCLLDKSMGLAKKSTMKSAQNSTINLLQLAATHGIDEIIHLSNEVDSKNESTPINQTYSGEQSISRKTNNKIVFSNKRRSTSNNNGGGQQQSNSRERTTDKRRQNSGENMNIQQLLRSQSSQQARAQTSLNSRDSQSVKRHKNFFNLNHHSIAEVNVSNYMRMNQNISNQQSVMHSKSFNNILQSQSNGSLNLKKLGLATNVQNLIPIGGKASQIRKSLENLPTNSQNLRKGYASQNTKYIKKQVKPRSSSAISMYRDVSQSSIPASIFQQQNQKHNKSSNAITRESSNGINSKMNKSLNVFQSINAGEEKAVEKTRSKSRETQKQIINVNQETNNFDPKKTWQEQLRSSKTNPQLIKSKSPMTRQNSSQRSSQNRLKNAAKGVSNSGYGYANRNKAMNALRDNDTSYQNYSTTSMNHISPSPYINNHNKYYGGSQATYSIPNSRFTSIEHKDPQSNPTEVRKYQASYKRDQESLKSLDQWHLKSQERLQTTQELERTRQQMVKSLTQSNQLNLKSIISKQNKKRPLSNCEEKTSGANKKAGGAQSKLLKHKIHQHQSLADNKKPKDESGLITDSAIRSYNTSSVNPSQNLKSESSNGGGKFQKIEFKRHDQETDELQTYYVQIPRIQDKIIQFFNMITPLIEGANFTEVNSNMKFKLCVLPQRLDILQISQQGGNQRTMLDIKSLSSFDIPTQTLETIKYFKNSNKKAIMNFIFNLKLKSDSGNMQFSTSNYSNLKRWAIGINALIQNQRSLVKLGQMMNLQS